MPRFDLKVPSPSCSAWEIADPIISATRCHACSCDRSSYAFSSVLLIHLMSCFYSEGPAASPQTQATSPHTQAASPQTQDTSPQTQATLPQTQATSPQTHAAKASPEWPLEVYRERDLVQPLSSSSGDHTTTFSTLRFLDGLLTAEDGPDDYSHASGASAESSHAKNGVGEDRMVSAETFFQWTLTCEQSSINNYIYLLCICMFITFCGNSMLVFVLCTRCLSRIFCSSTMCSG